MRLKYKRNNRTRLFEFDDGAKTVLIVRESDTLVRVHRIDGHAIPQRVGIYTTRIGLHGVAVDDLTGPQQGLIADESLDMLSGDESIDNLPLDG